MKKIFLNLAALFLITGAVYAQEFYFGFSPGEISSVYSTSGDKSFTTHMYVFHITGNLIFSVVFKNNVALETGLIYYNYPYLIKGPISKELNIKPNVLGLAAYQAFSLPLHVGYKFKLANRLYANVYSGLNFDFYFSPANCGYMPYKYSEDNYEEWGWNRFGDLVFWSERSLQKRFNVMFANRVSLQYFTKFNMGISVYASYYSGLRQVWESTLHYTYDFGETINKNIYLSHGSYWNFGIELGFKIGNKEERKAATSARKEQRKKVLELLKD